MALSGLVGGGRLERDNGYSFSVEIRNWPGILGPDGNSQAPKVQNQLSLAAPWKAWRDNAWRESLASDRLSMQQGDIGFLALRTVLRLGGLLPGRA